MKTEPHSDRPRASALTRLGRLLAVIAAFVLISAPVADVFMGDPVVSVHMDPAGGGNHPQHSSDSCPSCQLMAVHVFVSARVTGPEEAVCVTRTTTTPVCEWINPAEKLASLQARAPPHSA